MEDWFDEQMREDLKAMTARMRQRENSLLLIPDAFSTGGIISNAFTTSHAAQQKAPTAASIMETIRKVNAIPVAPPLRFFRSPYATKSVRARRHRKTRVDKKWRKRYGYKLVSDDKLNNLILLNKQTGDVYCGYNAYEPLMQRLKAEGQKGALLHG